MLSGLTPEAQPMAQPLWVWLVLNEQPPSASLTGGALIVAALLADTLVTSYVAEPVSRRDGEPPRHRAGR